MKRYWKGFIIGFCLIFTAELWTAENENPTIDQSWVEEYKNASVDEEIEMLFSLKTDWESLGYEMPALSQICLQLKEDLLRSGIVVDEGVVQAVLDRILEKEASRTGDSNSAKHLTPKPRKKEVEFSDEFAVGFVKALGGALLCIIPHPVTWGIGGALVADGVAQMANHSGDTSGSIERKINNLPPPPENWKPN